MPNILPFRAAAKLIPGECVPYVRATIRGTDVMHAYGAMTADDWENLEHIKARCLACGGCPVQTAELLMTPRRMVRPPATGSGLL